MKSEEHKFQKELTAEEKSIIITEVNKILNSNYFHDLGFHGGLSFGHYPYYLYFGDSNKELRRISVSVFAIWLSYWITGCSYRFWKQSELYKYIKALVEHKEEIEKDFPVLFSYIISFLIELIENYKGLEELRMKPYIIEIVKKDILDTKTIYREKEYIKRLDFDEFLKELTVKDYDKPFY